MTSTDLQERLTAIALLGTDRRAPTPAISGALGRAISALDQADPETALLGAAAMAALHRRAGSLPVKIDDACKVTPCAQEISPICSARATIHVQKMLNGEFQDVLPEWLTLAICAGRIPPPFLLPEILDYGARRPEAQERVSAAVGERGRWLAQMNPAWAYAVAGQPGERESLEAWGTGNLDARLDGLRRLRRQNPKLAREAAFAFWADEAAEARSAVLATFATGLSLDDEPFLENALDDRRKEVRRLAVALLSSLPESQLVHRMIQRVTSLVKFVRNRKPLIEVAFPQMYDRAMMRDGVEENAPSGEIGRRAFWLRQMLAAVPPAYWACAWGISFEELLMIVRRSEWARTLLEGLSEAARRHGDLAFAEAYFQECDDFEVAHAERLMDLLPAAQREKLALSRLEISAAQIGERFTIAILTRCTHQWSAGFAAAVLCALQVYVMRSGKNQYAADWPLIQLALRFGLYFPPDLADCLAEGWPTQASTWPFWKNNIEKFIRMVQFRCEMHEAFLVSASD